MLPNFNLRKLNYLNNKIQFEVEPRYALIFQDYDGDDAGFGYGIGLGGYYGKFIQIGIKTMIINIQISDTRHILLFANSLLIVRVPIRW